MLLALRASIGTVQQRQPVGQFLSCSIVRQAFPGVKHVSGVAADAVLRTPGIRSMYAWMGIRRAGRASILDMFKDNINVRQQGGGVLMI